MPASKNALSKLRLYNTFTKNEEDFVLIESGKVRMYTCGPTVYGRPHIGNYSSFLMADLLRRWLEVSGYEVRHVKNITDVGHLVADQDHGEDKIEQQAKREKLDPLAIARKYTEQYLEDERALNILEPFARPKATETIPEMIAIIEELVRLGHAYETEDGVYFAVTSFPEYGKLSGNTLENLSAGARVEIKEAKKHPADFALWKKTVGENAKHILRWPSPWGEGFPGWHIECSAMAKKLLGEQLDIHTGGEDNIFPHHESEIAQSEASGPRPFVRVWLHKRRIDMGKEKMSKSLGNVLHLQDIVEKGFDPLDLRYYLLSVHYRTQLKFTWKGMEDARKARHKILEWFNEVQGFSHKERESGDMHLKQIESFHTQFIAAMNSDLNTPAALAAVFEAMAWYRNNVPFSGKEFLAWGQFIDAVRHTFGCFEETHDEPLPDDIRKLIAERDAARAQKNFAEADRLRKEIAKRGFVIDDTEEGSRVRRAM